MALSYINNKEIKFGSSKPLNGVYTPGSPTREYEPLDSLGIYLNSGIPLSYGVENGRYISMSDEFAATSQGNSYSFNQLFAAQMMLGFKLHDRFIACDTEHKIIGTEPLLHKAYLAEITEKTLDYFKIKIYEEKTRTFCIRMSSSEVPTSYVDLTNSFDENGLNLTQTDRQSFLSYYRFYPLTARDPSSRAEETLGVDYYLLPSAEGLKELSGDILSKFNAFISSDGALTSLGNTAFAYAGDINYVPNYRGETSEAAVSAAESARVILGQVEEMHADINQILPEMEENLELTKQYRDEAMSTEIGTVREDLNQLKGDLDTERNARIEADTDHSTRIQKVEVASSVNRYEIDNLKAKAEGKLYRTETVETEAYDLDVPSSVAPYAEVQKIGGKSVVWNQLVDPKSTSINGVTITASNGMWTLSGTSTKSGGRTISISSSYPNFIRGNKYAILIENTANIEVYLSNKSTSKIITGIYLSKIITPSDSVIAILGINLTQGNEYSATLKINIFDLTLMFGVGNEPTLEECQKIFSADYYPYDAGTIKSFPVKMVKSRGQNLFDEEVERGSLAYINTEDTFGNEVNTSNQIRAKNFIKVEPNTKYSVVTKESIFVIQYDGNQKAIKKPSSYVYGYIAFSANGSFVTDASTRYIRFYFIGSYGTVYKNDVLIAKGDASEYSPYKETFLDVSSLTTNLKSVPNVYDTWQNGKIIKRVGERAYTEGDELDTTLLTDGTTTYYPLDIPTEEAIPEISNYIQVEGGGTLTFESDDAVHMPVPSTGRFVVDLS